MSSLGEDVISTSDVAPFHKIANAAEIGLDTPPLRRGDALRTWVRHLSGFQKEAVVLSARTGQAWRVVSDEGDYLNGHDAAPAPLPFLTAGMVAATMNEILALADQRGVAIRRLKLTQDNLYTLKGSIPARTMMGGALPVELEVEIDCDLDEAELNQFLMDAIHGSPLNGLMHGVHESLFTLSKNGQALAPRNVAALDAPQPPPPSQSLQNAQPEETGEVLVEKLALSPAFGPDGAGHPAGKTLPDDGSRLLHVRGVCALRDDGLKDITTMLHDPRGTSFKFVSEEAPVNGGQGRAPDAATLISAGIGLCFMTQFGRFASAGAFDLQDYGVIQDTHFSLGGATGGTGKAGEADPVETHVYLTSSSDDDLAREMLDMSERTCFLHAFCRTDMKTKLKVTRA